MKASRSWPSYWNPGRRVIQFGVNRCSESQLWLRQRCATFPRSSTTCSMPRSDRQWLMASPACPPPMITVSIHAMPASTCVDADVHRHAVGKHIEDRRPCARLLDDLAQLLRRSVACDSDVDSDAFVPVADRVGQAQDAPQIDVAFDARLH